ncbi:16S rRNA (cytosine(1402)-N(4))-methyltransferase RsmH [Roseicyclus sp. F158]|uniref:Ribosomal RNA small subunit methyltransferase H n=1 Tax=Tropicimonas omnivorans TaxID=3075590 RepID=A0ABU3DI39_9RHOB|nr:16S rRNA (cytosine(1402)-N(4))-methyltransferase RsmH [Roseicyclus sp. F158]MDT0683357.1 16S rRNA (cytosine(1402)-N(4))-methyltransferase RsmH [Roseicyclus sp. F158]
MASADTAPEAPKGPHVPVLIDALIEEVSPVRGTWLDGTFGAGGYTERLLQAGADRVIALDRDPTAIEAAEPMQARWGDRLDLRLSRFSELDAQGDALDGVALDLGVSSMQIDRPERGFSFQKDGPLDMRMGDDGPSAADLVNTAEEAELADILFHYGEERASRRIARAILRARPFETTGQLAEVIASCLPRQKPGQMHPATRSFQAIRIAVNDEMGELARGLAAAERALKPGGALAVVTFHSLEDRVVKRYLAEQTGAVGQGSRHAPAMAPRTPRFEQRRRKATAPGDAEIAGNPRARSAKLRVAFRTDAEANPPRRSALGLPGPKDWWLETGNRE